MVELNNIDKILEIYNSNMSFRISNLGNSNIYRKCILNEINEMRMGSFISSIIKDSKGEIIGMYHF